jgi:hypothetical protein
MTDAQSFCTDCHGKGATAPNGVEYCGCDEPSIGKAIDLTTDEVTHLLALALQFAIVERTATVSRQINDRVMGKLNRGLL